MACMVEISLEFQTDLKRFTVMCLSIGTPKLINFPFRTNEKLIILGVSEFVGHLPSLRIK